MELIRSGSDCVDVGETEWVLMDTNGVWQIYMDLSTPGQTECNVADCDGFVRLHANLTAWVWVSLSECEWSSSNLGRPGWNPSSPNEWKRNRKKSESIWMGLVESQWVCKTLNKLKLIWTTLKATRRSWMNLEGSKPRIMNLNDNLEQNRGTCTELVELPELRWDCLRLRNLDAGSWILQNLESWTRSSNCNV